MNTPFQDTSNSHKADLECVNERIRLRLHSNNSMLSEIVLSMLRTKGKQLRPLLVLMCAKIFAPVNDKVLAASAAVELLQIGRAHV